MTGPQNDDEFEAYLRRRSMLSGRKLESLEPPAALDDIVLARARRAIETPSRVLRYQAPRWAFPVGLAATILLCVSVLLNISLNMRRHSAELTHAAKVVAQAPADARPTAGAPASPTAGAPVSPAADAVSAPPAARVPAANAARSAAAAQYAPAPPAAAAEPAPGSGMARGRQAADPRAWLKRIESLRAQGKAEQAEAEWKRFRQAFPAYPVTSPPAESGPPK
jgi:hypothetical protein